MKRSFLSRIGEKLIEGLLALSGAVTSITVILIILFLFSEGLSIFGKKPVSPDNVLAVNSSNPVKTLTPAQIKDIFDQKITRWDAVGGNKDSILLFRVDDITNFFPDSALGDMLQFIPHRINDLMKDKPNILAYFNKNNLDTLKAQKITFTGRQVEVASINPANFLTGKEWFPTAEPAAQYGVLALILGTLWVSFGAIAIALPLGLATAIFMAEIANNRVRNYLKPVIELLAGIPSVVYGFFGLVIIVPAIKDIFHLDVGETGLAGSIILGIMALPTIITISEDALRTVPRELKEASLALGASHWQTIRRVVVPYAASGITAAIILGIGRAVGETMAVLMVTGNAAVIPHSFFEPLRTIPATIAAELGEASYGGIHFQALFGLGCILFIITFLINLGFSFLGSKHKQKA